MRQASVTVLLAVVTAVLAMSAAAEAGPPPSCYRATSHCDLTYYAATQVLSQKVFQKLRPRLTSAFGSRVACGPTEHRSPGFARCTMTVEAGGLPVPCTVEALFSRRKGTAFRTLWWKESQSCQT
jgi:hypothetical protein